MIDTNKKYHIIYYIGNAEENDLYIYKDPSCDYYDEYPIIKKNEWLISENNNYIEHPQKNKSSINNKPLTNLSFDDRLMELKMVDAELRNTMHLSEHAFFKWKEKVTKYISEISSEDTNETVCEKCNFDYSDFIYFSKKYWKRKHLHTRAKLYLNIFEQSSRRKLYTENQRINKELVKNSFKVHDLFKSILKLCVYYGYDYDIFIKEYQHHSSIFECMEIYEESRSKQEINTTKELINGEDYLAKNEKISKAFIRRFTPITEEELLEQELDYNENVFKLAKYYYHKSIY